MKKRLKGLFALCLALCMIMGMTTTMASAESDGVDVFGVQDVIVNAGENLYSSYSGGFLGVYYEGEAATEEPAVEKDLFVRDDSTVPPTYSPISVFYYEQTDRNTANRPTVRTVDEFGYVKDQWSLSSVMPENEEFWEYTTDTGYTHYYDVPIRYEAYLTMIPINYTIKYVDGAGNTVDGEIFTVEQMSGAIADANDLGFEKEGYTADAHWTLEDGTTVEAGTDVEDIYVKLIGNAVASPSGDAAEMEIVLTASWTEGVGGDTNQDDSDKDDKDDVNKGDEGETEKAPTTGDSSNMMIWLMAAAVGMGIALKSRKNEA